jgi:hypothetical protein
MYMKNFEYNFKTLNSAKGSYPYYTCRVIHNVIKYNTCPQKCQKVKKSYMKYEKVTYRYK